MNGTGRFIWRTIIAGVLFLAPLLLLLLLAREVIGLLAKILRPIAARLPFESLLGLPVPDIAAAAILLLFAFLAGLAAQARSATRLRQAIEKLILSKVPGYTLFTAIAEGAAGESSNLKVALANIDDAWLMSFIVEEHADGMLTVFVPSAPTPTAGSIYFLTEKQVKRLDIAPSAAVKCIMQLGVGSRALLEGKIAENKNAGT